MKWLHNLLKGISLTGALFVFEACYGVPLPPLLDNPGEAPMSFSLVSRLTGEPLQGIQVLGRVSGDDWYHSTALGITGEDGMCNVEIPYDRNTYGPFLRFEDPEGLYIPKDTVLTDLRERNIIIKLDPLQ
ncbi:MAG: hypothetical protein II095_02425 [Bacteroidales bacterium]|nr:hypothetical protein [Bacteroidales bacterium]